MSKMKKMLLVLLVMVMASCLLACNNKNASDDSNKSTEPTLNPGSADCVHVWNNWQEVDEATCTKKGSEERICSLCGKQEQQRTPATGHYFNEGVCAACGRNERACEHQSTQVVVIKEATCTERGQRNVLCTICDAVITTDHISAKGHGESTTVILREATCTENGKAQQVCTLCGGVDYEYTIYSEGHTSSEWIVVEEATCTEYGYKKKVCTVCDVLVNETTIYSTGHQDTEWIVITEPTCTEQGYQEKVCHTCDTVIDYYYPSSKGHTYTYTGAKTPTCTEDGWYEYRVCDVCQFTNYDEKFRPATGHNNIAGLCGTCGATDPAFVKTEIAGITKVEHTISKPVSNVFNAPAAQFVQEAFAITEVNETFTYSFTAMHTGTYYFWISELYSGNSVKLYVRNYLGESVKSSTNMTNNSGVYMTLEAGQTYTVELITRTCAMAGTYILNIGCQTATADISAYTAVNDSMSFANQVNYYTFTPAVDGIYRFAFSNMVSGCDVDIYVYNSLGEQVTYSTYCNNTEGVNINNMAAGQQYTIKVVYRSGKSAYTLQIYKQQATVDISGFNTIHDNLYYSGQKNYYTFTVPADGNYRFELGNITDNSQVYLYLYNSLGENIKSDSYAANGTGFTMNNLVAGQVYTIYVGYKSSSVPYTLYVYAQKATVALTDNSGAADSFEYKQQTNTYVFTAKEGGSYRIAITGMLNGVEVSVQIYDANGTLIKSNNYCENGEYLSLTDLVPGATYTIKVYANGVLTDYVISVQ